MLTCACLLDLVKQECIPVGCVKARSLTVSPYLVVSHTRPPLGSNHDMPLWSNHACPPGSNQACPPQQPHMPPRATTHAPPEQPCMPPHTPPGATTHTPPWTECGHTLLKILPCPNFVAGGNKVMGKRCIRYVAFRGGGGEGDIRESGYYCL